ncbi:MAG: hypothetical protein U0V70_16235 [Terriglobia bacterium]
MNKRTWYVMTVICAMTLALLWAVPASAQTAEVKEKPPMYTYLGIWNIPRAQWGEMEKSYAAGRTILDKAMASGTLVAYGNDLTLVHQPDGPTHDEWWSGMSIAALLNVLDQFYKSGTATSSVLASATKHWDNILVSRYYNWRSGTWKDAYTRGAYFKLKPATADDALEMISKTMLVPLMEKLLAEGAIYEYEIDTEVIHTEAPGAFWLFYQTPNAEGIDKINMAVRSALKSSGLGGVGFDAMVDLSAHRDLLVRTNASYK